MWTSVLDFPIPEESIMTDLEKWTSQTKKMRLEEAMMYCLVNEGRGLSVPQLTYLINLERLHRRKDGDPVTEEQVWACYFRNRHTFVWEGGVIHLVM